MSCLHPEPKSNVRRSAQEFQSATIKIYALHSVYCSARWPGQITRVNMQEIIEPPHHKCSSKDLMCNMGRKRCQKRMFFHTSIEGTTSCRGLASNTESSNRTHGFTKNISDTKLAVQPKNCGNVSEHNSVSSPYWAITAEGFFS